MAGVRAGGCGAARGGAGACAFLERRAGGRPRCPFCPLCSGGCGGLGSARCGAGPAFVQHRCGIAVLEINLNGGYSGEFANGMGFDVGYIAYIYPNSGGGWNGSEVYGSLSMGILTTKLSWGTSGVIDEHARLSFLIEQPLTERLTLEAGVGFRNRENLNSGATDYRLGLTYALTESLSTSAIWSGADTDRAGPAGKGRLVLGLTQSF
ncbi:hypothetical protein G4L37_08195 [Serpentinimonas maccroryi]|nr:TorF family putative porin [Serpentinimonas maccroryi]MBA4252553.1 hypothetical protein [Comamonadaceae bacterium]MCM2479422.1 hypothetical protein [Serpentinimonas maccroryi]